MGWVTWHCALCPKRTRNPQADLAGTSAVLVSVVTTPMPWGSLAMGPTLGQNPQAQDHHHLYVEPGLDPLQLPVHLHVLGTWHLLILRPRFTHPYRAQFLDLQKEQETEQNLQNPKPNLCS